MVQLDHDQEQTFNTGKRKQGSQKMTRIVTPSAWPAPGGNSHPARRHTANSSVTKRSIIRDGHKSSVSLEDEFWTGLREIAGRENMTVSTLVATIDQGANRRNLSSAIRVFVLGHFRTSHEHQLPMDAVSSGTTAASTPPL
jgi:predicted DNA-binding ribbon-helix-helix protein